MSGKNKSEQSTEMSNHLAELDAKRASAFLTTQHSTAIKSMGREIITDTVKVGEKYFKLCKYIRDNMVAPKLVSFELTELGFHRVTVSKINKVANSSDDLWSDFAAKTIGFNKVLELARGEVPGSLAKSMGSSVVDVKAQIEELEGETKQDEAQGEVVPETDAELEAKREVACNRAAAVLCRACEDMDDKKRIWNGGKYLVTVTLNRKWKPETGE